MLFVLPAFFHAIDFGHQCRDVSTLNNSVKYKTKNLTITGFPLINQYISLETTNLQSRVSSYEYFIPIIPANWKEGDEIKCVMKLKGNELDEIASEEKQLSAKNNREPQVFEAVVRNTLWEEIDDDVLEELKKTLKVSGDMVMIEYGTKDIYPFWLGGIIFLIASLGSYKILTDKEFGKT